jgi:hypothetical protein
VLPLATAKRTSAYSAILAGLIGRPLEQRERDAEFNKSSGHRRHTSGGRTRDYPSAVFLRKDPLRYSWLVRASE